MIARITGKVAEKSPDRAIVDVNGVGYLIYVPLSTYYLLPEPGQTVTLHTYTHVREDALVLYGFKAPDELESFQLLIGVTNIGPKLALNILSGISVKDLRKAIAESDIVKLHSVPGVGPKTAERITFELRDKMGVPALEEEAEAGATPMTRIDEEAVSALINLGYTPPVAESAVALAAKSAGNGAELKELIKESLKILSG